MKTMRTTAGLPACSRAPFPAAARPTPIGGWGQGSDVVNVGVGLKALSAFSPSANLSSC